MALNERELAALILVAYAVGGAVTIMVVWTILHRLGQIVKLLGDLVRSSTRR